MKALTWSAIGIFVLSFGLYFLVVVFPKQQRNIAGVCEQTGQVLSEAELIEMALNRAWRHYPKNVDIGSGPAVNWKKFPTLPYESKEDFLSHHADSYSIDSKGFRGEGFKPFPRSWRANGNARAVISVGIRARYLDPESGSIKTARAPGLYEVVDNCGNRGPHTGEFPK